MPVCLLSVLKFLLPGLAPVSKLQVPSELHPLMSHSMLPLMLLLPLTSLLPLPLALSYPFPPALAIHFLSPRLSPLLLPLSYPYPQALSSPSPLQGFDAIDTGDLF
eukprot:gnl/MRDRNA2_/MRDRNA2_190066_c0_seq1.p1 gnl/MRDRNA2_/MRDRNA2_190066_c0~~gnl/MRDRNA2_/MRDRNA2_190066_c0_seq1.p1  ORF type:complete len:106 (+),score=4.17 gnl/MRDRNA2_/MRDRNA2_190066_c0_seq1:72-389(+)